MEFWRRPARISRKDKIRINIITQKLNVTRFLLEDIKTKQLQCYGRTCPENGEGNIIRSTEMATIREKKTR
jgi:hypothetical protein